MTNEQLETIEAALADVQPGLPWASRESYDVRLDETTTHVIHHGTHHGNVNATVAEVAAGYDAEALLIEKAPEWIAALVAEVRRLRSEIHYY